MRAAVAVQVRMLGSQGLLLPQEKREERQRQEAAAAAEAPPKPEAAQVRGASLLSRRALTGWQNKVCNKFRLHACHDYSRGQPATGASVVHAGGRRRGGRGHSGR